MNIKQIQSYRLCMKAVWLAGMSMLIPLLSGCSDEITAVQVSSMQEEIVLSGSISQQNVTRANDYGFVGGDRMGVYIVDYENGEAGQLLATDNRASNIIYTYDADNYRWTTPATVYWRDKQTPVDVYAYYPSTNYIAAPTAWDFSVLADQSTEVGNGDLGGYEQSDLLWGKQTKVAPTTDVITVKLQHRLAGVRVQLQKGTGISDTEWAKLEPIVLVENTVLEAFVNLSTGEAATKGSKVSAVRMCPQSDDAYRAVVIPQVVEAGKHLVSVTIDGISYSHTLSTSMKYQSGKLHNFTLTVNKSEATGDYSITLAKSEITDWINDETSHQFSSQQYVIVHCDSIGTLKECIAKAGLDYKTIKNLKVTGELTTEDLQLINNEMPELRHLNIRDVKLRHILFYDSWLEYGNHDHNIYVDDYLKDLDRNEYIRSIVLPSSLKRIDGFTHMGLMYSTLEIPEGVTYLGGFGFNDYQGGSDYGVEIVLPTSLDTIASHAFYHCHYKCNLRLTDNITYIGSNAFDEAVNFYGTIHIPSKLKELPFGAFSAMGAFGEGLYGEIEIPQGVEYVNSLPDVWNRIDLVIPEGVKELNSAPSKLSSLHLPSTLESVGAGAFQWHSLPFQLTLPEGLKRLDTNAFNNCGLEGELIIPESCLNLGGGCISYNPLTKVTLPSKLETIPNEMFVGMMLTSLTIPKYVSYIGDRGLGCEYLQTVICLNPEPPALGTDAFSGIYLDKCVLEVPEQSVETYRHTDGWKDFKNITAYHELAFNIPEMICLDKGTTRTGILRAEGDWEVSECPDWVTVSPSSGTYKEELTVTVSPNSGATREGKIVFNLKGKNYTTYTDVRQVAADVKEDQVITLQAASTGGTPVPIYIIGEGYGADDIASGKYVEEMNAQMEHLFSTEPYKTYRNYFTVKTAIACAPESGMNGKKKFEDDWGDADNHKVWDYIHDIVDGNVSQEDATVLVLCNTQAYGNHTDIWDNGFSVAWIGKTEDIYPYDQRGEVLHNLGGRAFGKLGPEYVNHFTFMKACSCPECNMTNQYNWARERGWWQNVSITPKMTELPWYHLIFNERYAQQVDVFEGALNHARSTYRSENQSVMGAAHIYYYNTISRELIVKRIMQMSGEGYSFEKFVANDKMEIPE